MKRERNKEQILDKEKQQKRDKSIKKYDIDVPLRIPLAIKKKTLLFILWILISSNLGFHLLIVMGEISNICWIIKKAREFQKNIYFCFINYAKAFDCVDHNKLWKILKEMGIPDHLTWLLRNLYEGQEATVRTGHGTTDWFQIGKGVRQGCILSPCLFNLNAKYIMRNAGLDEAQAGIKIAGRNII